MQEKTFFDMLRFSLGITDKLDTSAGLPDWMALLEQAEQQSLIGIMFSGIERLPREQRPQDKETLFTWFAAAEMIRQTSKTVSEHTAALFAQMEADGLSCCLLKGQGNALLYPDPAMRTPGDIDVWVTRGGRLDVKGGIAYARQHGDAGEICYHHIDYGQFEGTDVELHFRPTFMHSPFNNRRLQRFFQEQATTQLAHRKEIGGRLLSVPTTAFNSVYQLVHIARHLFQNGIGLRQIVDYYFVLRQGFSEAERTSIVDTWKRCGLLQVAGAMMYVMQHLFRLDDAYLLVAPDERRGRFLLREIMAGGNFGQYDQRVSRFARETAVGRNWQRLVRDWRTAWLFPSESLWEPLFRIWHFFWRHSH